MAISGTTLSGAVGASDTQINVTSATGITAGTSTTGANLTYLYIESEIMIVQSVNGTLIGVTRGQLGTQQVAHATSTNVLIGTPADFPNFVPAQGVTVPTRPDNFQGISAAVASALSITPSGPLFHITGTTATATIVLPTGFVEGSITIIADGVWTWTAADNILVAGTVTTAGSTVTFIYDAKTSKWYPSRLA